MMKLMKNTAAEEPTNNQRIKPSEELYHELRDFLDDEADLLDEDRLKDWLDLMDKDLHYFMPVRIGVQKKEGKGFAENMGWFDDSYNILATRILRLTEATAWTEDPPSRVMRIIAGVRSYHTDNTNEFHVQSKILLTRTRTDAPDVTQLSARRSDIIRRCDDGFKLAKRTIYIQHTTIGMQNLAIFL